MPALSLTKTLFPGLSTTSLFLKLWDHSKIKQHFQLALAISISRKTCLALQNIILVSFEFQLQTAYTQFIGPMWLSSSRVPHYLGLQYDVWSSWCKQMNAPNLDSFFDFLFFSMTSLWVPTYPSSCVYMSNNKHSKGTVLGTIR